MPRLATLLAALLFAGGLAGCRGGVGEALPLVDAGPEALARLAVSVEAPAPEDSLGVRRAFFLADGAGATFFDALSSPQDHEAMGLAVGGEHLLDGWRWWFLADSMQLGPEERTQGAARPDYAVRAYAERDTSGWIAALLNRVQGEDAHALAERVTLLDGRNALLVEVTADVGEVAFRPVAGDRGSLDGYEVRAEGETLLIARGDTTMRRRGTVPAQWIAVRATGGRAVAEGTEEEPEAGRTRAFGLGRLEFATPGRVVVAAGATPEAAAAAAAAALAAAEAGLEARSQRMARFLDEHPFETGDDAFDRALAWSRLTLDALVVRDTAGAYLLPGIAGAEPADGRSALQALDALLLSGQWELARGLLATYGRAQRFDDRIDVLGRAPNVVLPGGQARYTSSDATPIYVAAAGDYVRATGDRGLVSGGDNFWFKTVFAFRGLYSPGRRQGAQLNPAGFLLARPGQTWTQTGGDADPADRPGVPVEAQGRLYRALRTMTEFATIMGVSGRTESRWYADTADVLRRDFVGRFVVGDSAVVDRYDPQGQPDGALRPNALLALEGFDLEPEREARLVRALAERLAYPWGVATRVQSDTSFHPFLRAPAYYAPEQAAYAGTVWTWLAGPLARLMAETGGAGKAYELVERTAALALEQGVVGAVADNVDAHPRRDDAAPAVGGAPVQPWTPAELIETAYAAFAGVRYAAPGDVVLEPHLPEAWDGLRTRVRVGGGWVGLEMEGDEDNLRVTLTPQDSLPEGARIRIRAFGLEEAVPLTVAQGDTAWAAAPEVVVEVTADGVEVGGEDAEPDARYPVPPAAAWEGFEWVQPDVRDTYPVMRAAAAERRLVPEDLLRENILAVPTLTQPDPDGDAWGSTSTYTYPRGFPAGVLDATYLEVTEDDSTTYFRAEFATLVPDDSLGFPPTFVAIAISTEEGGRTRVERGAQYDFPEEGGYEYVVFIGDGLVLEDAAGRVLAEVEPGQGRVFNPANGALAFAIPRRVLPELRRARVTMLVGARAEGGGVGEFRDVERTASRSAGGGKVDPAAPNVYDQVTGLTR